MYLIVYFTQIQGVYQVNTYGPFATYDAADAWRAANLIYGIGAIVKNYNPVPLVPNGPLTPTAVGVNQYVGVFIGVDQSGVYQLYSFGPFTTQQLAQTFVGQQFQANSYAVGVVTNPPG